MRLRKLIFISSLQEKANEAISAVLPIMAIVLVLAFTIVPVPNSIMLAFVFAGIMIIAGMMFFSLGAEIAMQPMGSQMGKAITGTRKIWLILITGFILGAMITVSEPDLQVLAGQVQSIPENVLIYSVAGGVGLFLVISLLRTFLAFPLRIALLVSYGIVFILVALAPESFLAVAFDSGGVTTGPMTVPFIMSFGVGISAFRNDKNASDDSFGTIALCSVGPILAVLILSIIFNPEDATYAEALVPEITQSMELSALFAEGIPEQITGIASALAPIIVFFGLFKIAFLHLNSSELVKILIGLAYTYIGLVIFLAGVNVGFMPAGSCLGSLLAALPYNSIIIPIGMLMGYYIVKAEPAVYVLMHQVEELTNGAVTGKALQRTLSFGVAVSIGISMFRVLTGVSILYFVIPGYAIALVLSFFVPPMFTGIAFDSGGVASGPMTATFLLPFAMGACVQLGGNVVTDAFGVVAMVAMTPLIAIQLLGLSYVIKEKKGTAKPVSATDGSLDYAIIDL